MRVARLLVAAPGNLRVAARIWRMSNEFGP